MNRLPYSIRPASEDDLEQVLGIEKKSIRPPWTLESFRSELHKPHSVFWVITDDETDERVYAYAVLSFPAEQAHLVTFAVDPDCRRQGVASLMLRQVIAFVTRKGGQSLILEVRKGNQPAVAFYQKVGFVVIRTLPKFYPDGEDAYVMIYKTERPRIPGQDPDTDWDEDGGPDGKKNLN